MSETYDTIVIGSGIAGLAACLESAQSGLTVALLTKSQRQEGATRYAQGGIAAAIDSEDHVQFHLEDTIQAGAGLCDEDHVRILVEEAPQRVQSLIDLGVNFFKSKSGDQYDLTQEGAHRQRRVLHAGDATGREIERALGQAVLAHPNVTILENTFVIDLLLQEGRCYGCLALQDGVMGSFFSKSVILATGGCCQVFSHTSTPPVATGDGIGLAVRAGCSVRDMEFVQFHPTTLYLGDKKSISIFLISEAVRGEGAVLRNQSGEAFMSRYHSKAELAPRDIVARAIFQEMVETGSQHVYLDMLGLDVTIKERFPTIYQRCMDAKIDPTKDFIPVAPAAHYNMGGVSVDAWGQTDIPGLLACGEVACLGLHGANRLASNSLLEGLVFGQRAARHALTYTDQVQGPVGVYEESEDYALSEIISLKQSIRDLCWQHVGIIRSETGLLRAQETLKRYAWLTSIKSMDVSVLEVQNLYLVAQLMVDAALARTESVGCHFRW